MEDNSLFVHYSILMLFPTPQFAVFILVALVLYSFIDVSAKEARSWFLAGAGLVFYASLGELPLVVLVFVASSALYFDDAVVRAKGPRLARLTALRSLPFLLAPLLYFKYGRFVSETLAALDTPLSEVFLSFAGSVPVAPAGISFFTFSAIALVFRRICVERSGGTVAVLSLSHRAAFLLFFPTILSGPLWRADSFAEQAAMPQPPIRYARAAGEFGLGLFLKLVIAGWAEPLANPAFDNPELYSSSALWGASFAYSIQIYGDFAGYTLMAIACGRLFGFELPENFDAPYLSRNLQDFWRRWHASLGKWFRDHLFVPIGGSRGSPLFAARNAFVVMLVSGVWHGAGWNFLVWGAAHGVVLAFLVWARLSRDGGRILSSFDSWGKRHWQAALSIFATFLFVNLSWIPFRASDMESAFTFLGGLFQSDGTLYWGAAAWLTLLSLAVLVFIEHRFGKNVRAFFGTFDDEERRGRFVWAFFACLYLISVELSPPGLPNFIYFQF